MANKPIKLKDLVKGSGFEEIPKKIFSPETGDVEKGGKKPVALVLPAKKEMVLQADTEEKRGLIVKWTDGKGYEIQYWYGTPDNIVPSELIADGTSKGSLTKINISNKSPGKSPPSQKLFVPKIIPLDFSLIPFIKASFEEPLSWGKIGNFSFVLFCIIYLYVSLKIFVDVNKTKVLLENFLCNLTTKFPIYS